MKKRPLLIAAIVLVILGIVFAASRNGAKTDTKNLYAIVRKGPLVISLREAGEIKPSEQINIKSEVEGRATIIYLVPEGSRVKKGDLLVELDTSSLVESRVDQEITVQNAEAAFVEARENLEVVRNQGKADVELAELTLQFAKEDLEKYREGEYPNTLNEQIGSVTLAEEEVERARDTYEWSKKLFAEKYLSETELRSDELSCKSKELSLKTAQGKLDLLRNYTYKREIAKLESDLSQAEMALDRTRRTANANTVQAEAKLSAKELEHTRQKDKLDKYVDQIAKAKIVAPMDGLVIYATSTQPRWHNQEPLAEGQEVRERQNLIVLPTADTYLAEVNIHENNLKKIYPGLPVVVRVDALPNRSFNGKIDKISPLPDGQRMWANPDLKVYKTTISIEGGGDVLKSGMNCHAEIIIDQYDDAIYVPVQAVVRVGGDTTVWVRGDKGDTERKVEIGLDNNRMVRILSGLEPGEEVLLTPPLGNSVASAEPSSAPGKPEEPHKPGEEQASRPAGPPPAPAGKPAGGETPAKALPPPPPAP